MHNTKKIMDTTINNRVYKRAYKKYLESTGKINCGFCPYHRYENWDRRPFKSWKWHRKTQWKNKDI